MKTPLSVDIAVIGAGTAGITAFHEVTRAGKSAVLIDRGPLGTTCARVGCMPSKAALHAGHQLALLRTLLGETRADLLPGVQDALWRHARATRDKLAAGAAQRTIAAAGAHLLMGTARFTGPHTIDVEGQSVQARAFVIATGSHPIVPASLAVLGERLLTTDTLFEQETLPRSIGILGLGAIGLEMGLALSRLGVRVVAGDLKTSVAGITDPEVNARAIQLLRPELEMWLGCELQANAQGDAITVRSGSDSAQVDVVLAALGRRPNIEGLGLSNAGITLKDHGLAVADPLTLRIAESNLFLAGDVVADRALMHEAADEGLIAARGALQCIDGLAPSGGVRRVPLSIVFSAPDIASIGMRYDAVDLEHMVVGSAQGYGNGRSRILGAEGNLLRIYAERSSGKLLGAGLVATHGEHLAHLLAWAIQREETIDSLLTLPYYHPSIEEMVQSALKDAARQRN